MNKKCAKHWVSIIPGSFEMLPRHTLPEYRDQRPLSVDPLNILPRIIEILPLAKFKLARSRS